MEVFWERGYQGTSLNDLTTATGVNSPSLYAAFGSKEALFREAVALYTAPGNPTDRALREEPMARQAVEAMLRDNADAYTHPDRPPGCMVVVAATTCAPENDAVRSHLADCRRDVRDALQQRLDRGLADGDLPAGTDTAGLAAFYITVLHGLSIQASDGASRDALHAIVKRAMTAWDVLAKPQIT